MKELKGIAKDVKDILERYEETRDSDWDLFIVYASEHTNLKVVVSSCFFPANVERVFDELSKVSYESIARARRKVQELYPHLLGNRRKATREQKQDEFFDFAIDTKKEDLE